MFQSCSKEQFLPSAFKPVTITTQNTRINSYLAKEQEIDAIPGYNYQSLFRKKSHIRLAKKRVKNQQVKSTIKEEDTQKQAKAIYRGHWNQLQTKLYHWFLQLHNRHFVFKHLRRADKVFKSMASFIGTRQPEQCRSHHQKMQKKFESFYQILLKLRIAHYSSTDPQILARDIKSAGYQIQEEILLSSNQLSTGEGIKLQNVEDSFSQILKIQQNEQQNTVKDNILHQNYENQLKFQL